MFVDIVRTPWAGKTGPARTFRDTARICGLLFALMALMTTLPMYVPGAKVLTPPTTISSIVGVLPVVEERESHPDGVLIELAVNASEEALLVIERCCGEIGPAIPFWSGNDRDCTQPA